MKKHLFRLSLLSLALISGFSYAETPPEGTVWFRPYDLKGEGDAGVSFSDVSTWNEYQDTQTGAWVSIEMDVLPWELPWAGDTQILLKMDNSIVNVDSAVGSADNLLNVSVQNLWYSTFNIREDFYIAGNITQAGYSTLNINSGADVIVNSLGSFDAINISGEGTTLKLKAVTAAGNNFTVSDGASVYMLGEQSLYVGGTESGVVFENSTLNGNLWLNGGKGYFKNSTLNAGPNNNPVQSSNTGTLVFEDSVINSYYTGWDSTSSQSAGWKGNVFFLGLGKGAQQTITLKNTVVNGGGAADGTSYWAMDESTRTLNDIASGAVMNLGWNTFENGDEFFVLNLESGTDYAGRGIEFGNAGGSASSFGSITVNQGGTDLADGYTRVHLNGDINMRASTFKQDLSAPVENTYSSNYNLLGYTEILNAKNLNVGHSASRGGSSTFTIHGAYNTVEIYDLYLNSGSDKVSDASGNNLPSDASVNLIFASDSSNSTLTINANINNFFGESGTNTIVLDGTNNTIKTNTFNLTNGTLYENEKSVFEMLGEGNVLDITRLLVTDGGRADAATGGEISLLFKGSNAENKNQVFLRNGTRSELLLQGSITEGSTFSANIEFGGNTVLRSNDSDSGVWVKIHEWAGKAYSTNSTMTVSGTGNDLLLAGLEIGNDVTTSEGRGTFKVASTGGRIEINSNNMDSFNGLRVNASGILSYAIQNGGIDTIYNYTKNSSTFRGKLEVDFRDMTRKTVDSEGLVGGWEKFTLLATVDATLMSTNGFLGTWFTQDDEATMADPLGGGYIYLIFNEEYVSVMTRGDADEYMFVIDESFIDEVTGDSLLSFAVLYKSTVPEPASIAAILGVLALAFALYRRRK